ncbi:MAG: sulfite reductase [NADPH] hemoprotein beta-component [Burkholderiales bacterium]|nr:MAG: sulfite reductase [NADPH] hemoprotein beta-component [Burkholderiales bacterium]
MGEPSALGLKLAAEEALKAASNFLRGTIAIGLEDPVTGALAEEDAKLLKFHGSYQQDDRDLRLERQRQKLEPAYCFMVRVRMPGGVCTPAQWLALDALARAYANGTLRITTRQTFQFHGVPKRHLKPLIAGINRALLNTIAACGDVNRNVICHNNPYLTPVHGEVHRVAQAISDRLLPRTRAYREIWLDEKPGPDAPPDDEPLYGPTYLPRKFKIGLAVPPVNDVDVFAQDLGFIAIAEGEGLLGFNVAVGGGMGMSHGEPATYPRLGDVIGFCPPEKAVEVAEEVVKVQRDYGDRTNRKHARLKYTLDDRGLDWFREELEKRLGWRLEAPRPFRFDSTGDPFGWFQDREGNWHLTLFVMSGRVQDTEQARLMTALREIARRHDGDFRLTANQNVTVAHVKPADKDAIDRILRAHGVELPEGMSALRLNALSCVALPTCGLAMAEAERWLPALVGRLEGVLENLGLRETPILLRVTGCPNGCARPYLAEIGLVGKSLGRYNLYLGASFTGERLNRLYRENLSEDEVVEVLAPVLEHYAANRNPGERFGDFAVRAGYVKPVRAGREFHDPS